VIKIAFSPVYKYQLPEGHRFPLEKYELLPEQLLYEGSISESAFFEPVPLTDEEILTTHTAEYLQKLKDNNLSYHEARTIGFPIRPELITRGRRISKGSFDCAVFAMQHGVALNIAGGTHHAFADRGEGFCIFNDFGITANLLLQKGLAKKILIVDLDVHQGNGTAHLFRYNPSVFTFSMHGAKNYPLRKEQSDLDLGVPDGIEDEAYLKLLKDYLPRLIDQVKPDIILYLAGVDVLESDTLGRLKLSREGCKMRDRIVFDLANRNQIPVAVSMGGGYSKKISDIVEAHANTFRVAAEIFG
jgi:acetoin utilization deacetylase AcuC-like enzyme